MHSILYAREKIQIKYIKCEGGVKKKWAYKNVAKTQNEMPWPFNQVINLKIKILFVYIYRMCENVRVMLPAMCECVSYMCKMRIINLPRVASYIFTHINRVHAGQTANVHLNV